MPIERLGHGVQAIEDVELVQRIVDEGIVLEVCPGSNLALGLYDHPRDHPLNDLRAAGVIVVLGSDDPPFFGTTIGAEYERAMRDFRLSAAALAGITEAAIDAAFVDDGTKSLLRAQLSIT